MQVVVITCLISIIPAILCAPDDDCPVCALNPRRCGPNCLQLDDQDDLETNPSRLKDEGTKGKNSKYQLGRSTGDLLCLNFPPAGKLSRLVGGMEGFVVNKGKFISLKDLLEMAHSRQGFKNYFKNPFDSRHENRIDMKQAFEDIGGIVLGRDGWGKLSPPWG